MVRTKVVSVASLFLALGVAMTLIVHTPPAHAAFEGRNGRIAFSSYRGGQVDIYSMRPHGGGVRNLTNDAHPDFQPAWSPDGRLITFASARGGGLDHIWVMRQDGKRPRALTATDQGFAPGDFMPDWQRLLPLPA